MLEKLIEQKLVAAVEEKGGLCLKFLSTTSGWPDRLVLMPRSRMAFVELKAPGEKPRPLQYHRHNQLHDLGFDVFVIDRPELIPVTLDFICSSKSKRQMKKESEELMAKKSP